MVKHLLWQGRIENSKWAVNCKGIFKEYNSNS